MEPSDYRVGVLFVHGIGTQKRGETLSMYTDAMFSWIRDRVRGVAEGHALRGTSRSRVTQAWGTHPRPYVTSAFERELKKLKLLTETAEIRGEGKVDQADGSHSAEVSPTSVSRDIAWHLAFIDTEKRLDRSVNPAKAGKMPIPPDEPLVAMANLSPEPSFRSDEPAAASVDINWIDQDHEKHNTRWLWAESWWAEAFDPPSFTKILRWTPLALLISVVTHYFSRHEHGTYDSSWQKWLGEVRALVALPFWFIVSMLVTPLVYMILVLTALADLLPWERLQGAALRVRALITGVIGDAFTLVEMPLSGAAIKEKVRRDLQWLSERCDRVLVVGHSQGALLAHLACRQDRPANVEALITLGAGIRKLRSLMAAADSSVMIRLCEGLLLAGYIFCVVLLGVLTLFIIGQLNMGSLLALGIVSSLSVLTVSLLAWSMSFVKAMEIPAEDAFWLSSMESERFLWLNLFASHDPVPAGDLSQYLTVRSVGDDVSPSAPLDYPPSCRITNHCSVLRDHSSYVTNREECVSALVWYCALLDRTGSHRWIAPNRDSYSQICNARRCIIRRAKRMFWAVVLLVTVMFAMRFASDELPNLVKQYVGQTTIWPLFTSLGLHVADIGLLLVIVSAFVAVGSAKAFALSRLESALLQRRFFSAGDETEDSSDGLVERAYPPLSQYAYPALGEWLGLAITTLLPLTVFMFTTLYVDEWATVLYTLFSIGLAWAATALLRTRQRGVWDVKQHRQPSRKKDRSYEPHCTNTKELYAIELYEKRRL